MPDKEYKKNGAVMGFLERLTGQLGDEDSGEQLLNNQKHDQKHRGFGGIDLVIIGRVVLAAALYAAAVLVESSSAPWSVFLKIIVLLIAGYDVLLKALAKLLRLKLFDEFVLISAAALVSFFIGQSGDGALLMLLYQFGYQIRVFAQKKSCTTVESLIHVKPGNASLISGGKETSVPAKDLTVGNIIYIRPGETVPANCIVTEGNTSIDTSYLTGDTEPRHAGPEDEIFAGTINLSSPVLAEVVAPYSESISAQALDSLSAVLGKKGKTERSIRSLAGLIAPLTVLLSLAVGIAAPLMFKVPVPDALYRSMIVLIAASPIAMNLTVPIAYYAGIGGAFKKGILIKDADTLDKLLKTGAVVFDKAGTLTTDEYRVVSVDTDKMEAEMMLQIAAHAEAYSTHPIAKAIIAAYGGEVYIELIQNYTEHQNGIEAVIDNIRICLGNTEFMRRQGVRINDGDQLDIRTTAHMSVDGEYAGRIVLDESIKEDAAYAIQDLGEFCGDNIVMVTGDSRIKTQRFADKIGVGIFYAECTLETKLSIIRDLRSGIGTKSSLAAVIGTGDPKMLEAADVGIIISGLETGVSAEKRPDVLLMDEKPSKVFTAIFTARNTRIKIAANIAIVLAIKLAVLMLGAAGMTTMWAAVLADMCGAVIAVLNSLRAFR